jgi:fermentation-respiration switch protein FrsA (DUF1100 family)
MQQQPPVEELVLRILGAEARQLDDGTVGVYLTTTRGMLTGRMHISPNSPGVVLWGSRGSIEEPRDRLYAELAQELTGLGISSLRLFFRMPDSAPPGFDECVLDMLAGISFLRGIGAQGIALVGTSFGGGVVINAGALSPFATAVVAMASQLHGARGNADKIAPRPLLLVHGEEDTVIEYEASQIILNWAGEPKEFVLFPKMGHSLDGPHRDDLKALLKDRLVKFVGREALLGKA